MVIAFHNAITFCHLKVGTNIIQIMAVFLLSTLIPPKVLITKLIIMDMPEITMESLAKIVNNS